MINKNEILKQIDKLVLLHQQGSLGGEVMPEDSNPHLPIDSLENYLYFTLPMALNYQRDSYTLWKSANKSYQDEVTNSIFIPQEVIKMDIPELREKLLKYKVALQPNKQPIIWQTLANTFVTLLDNDLRNLFIWNDYSVAKIKDFMLANKKSFPYLSGNKIINYWLYVMQIYTDVKFIDRENITIAPDTHVIQASIKLGIISLEEAQKGNVQELVVARWQKILVGTNYQPIDIHTPFWLWSREKFSVEI